jgi:hypothetical protein
VTEYLKVFRHAGFFVSLAVARGQMLNLSKAFAFDLDQAGLISLRKAPPDYVIEVVNGAWNGQGQRQPQVTVLHTTKEVAHAARYLSGPVPIRLPLA